MLTVKGSRRLASVSTRSLPTNIPQVGDATDFQRLFTATVTSMVKMKPGLWDINGPVQFPADRLVDASDTVWKHTHAADQATSTIKLGPRSGVVGPFEAWDPRIVDRQIPDLSKTPWLFEIPYNSAPEATVQGVRPRNIGRFLRVRDSNCLVRDIVGWPIYGIEADAIGNTLTVENVRFNEPWSDEWNDPANQPFVLWMRANGISLNVGVVHYLRVQGFFALNYAYGCLLQGSTLPPELDGDAWRRNYAGGYGDISDLVADNCGIGVYCMGSLEPGWQFKGGGLSAADGNGHAVLITDGPTLTFDGTEFSSWYDQSPLPLIDMHKGKLALTGCHYRRPWDHVPDGKGRATFLRAAEGQFSMVGGSVAGTEPGAVDIGDSVSNVVINAVAGLKERIQWANLFAGKSVATGCTGSLPVGY